MTLVFDQGLAALRAGDLPEARRWLESARRQEPWNAGAALALGSVLIRQRDKLAVSLHREILAAGLIEETLCGLAASLRMVGQHAEAAVARGRALSLFAGSRSAGQEHALGEYCRAAQIGGWCGLGPSGRLTIVVLDPLPCGDIHVTLDGALFLQIPAPSGDVARFEIDLPEGWAWRRTLGVQADNLAFLGYPISLADIRYVEGLADARDGGIHGWAWCPHDPEYEPQITLRCGGRIFGLPVKAEALASDIKHWRPLAKPRRFAVPAAALRGATGPIEILGRDGRNLYGSPVDPAAWAESAAFAARQSGLALGRPAGETTSPVIPLPRTPMFAVPATVFGGRPQGGERPGACVVLVPIHGAREMTLRCLDSVLAKLPPWARIVAVNDASEDPQLIGDLAGMAAQGRLTLLNHATNAGFPAAVNTGLAFAMGRDVVLLNSDTLVAPGWLERLRATAYSGADIGTVTPLSNDATLVSYPDSEFTNPVPDLAETRLLDSLASRAGDEAVELPTAVGFCMYIKRDCLRDTGGFRADVFAQGYGEENDFCMRARHLGWRHVAAPNVFVGHVGGQSFSGARVYLRARNLRILNELHPGYDALITDFMRADPLAPARRTLDRLRWEAARDGRPAVLLITHGRRGGIQRRVHERAQVLRAEGKRPLCLWPVAGRQGGRDCVLGDGPEGGTPNLRYAVADELESLAELLRGDKIARIEVHSLIGHDHDVLALPGMLGIPYDMVVHDYAAFCPRITLVTGETRYCGEPDIAGCESCISDFGVRIEEDVGVRYLRARSAAQLAGAASIVVPSADVAQRIKRHFPGLAPIVTPWEDDAAIAAPDAVKHAQGRVRVCIIGAIGPEKGFDVLLACAKDAQRRSLDLDYVVVGHSSDDGSLLKLGNVHITGEYDEAELVDLIRRQNATLAFLPSIWPETWSYTLSHAWRAGLRVIAFDLGAPAERIRNTGWGALIDPATPADCINDGFLRASKPPDNALAVKGGADGFGHMA